jgi:hypothetical protein
MIVWRLASKNTSVWYIPFFFWAFYHGQSVNFATDKKIMIMVLQLLILVTFILGNAFQGLITSFMIEKIEAPRLSSVDELLESDYKLLVGNHFEMLMQGNLMYQRAVLDGRVNNSGSEMVYLNFTQLHSENYAIMVFCEIAKYYIDKGDASNFYVINENLFARYDQLQTIFLSKFLKRWQLLMDWSFEAGLHQAWEKMESDEKVLKEVDEEMEILWLTDIAIVFYTLIIGCVIGGFALLCEIFYHNFLQPFLRRRKILKETAKWKRLFKLKLIVRKRRVHPINLL